MKSPVSTCAPILKHVTLHANTKDQVSVLMTVRNSKENSEKEIYLNEVIKTESMTSIDENEINDKSKLNYITSKTDKSKETK